MREILFRGKRVDNGKWVEGHLIWCEDGRARILPSNTDIFCYEMDESIIQTVAHRVIPETVGQYTGLTDKNGTKIFEGDIIRYADYDEYRCYIESLDCAERNESMDFCQMWTVDEIVYGIKIAYPAFDLNSHDFESNGLSVLNESGQYYYEVIGNIHDNPELLDGVGNG